MGDYDSICELRGRKLEGKGCSRIEGLARCGKRSGGRRERMCTGNGFDSIVDAAAGAAPAPTPTPTPSVPFTSVPAEGWRVTGTTAPQQDFSVVEQGYDGTGTATPVNRTVRITNIGRLGFPNQATPSDKYSLTRYLLSSSNVGVANVSSRVSPIPVANFITQDGFLVGNQIGGNVVPIEVSAFHWSGIACVKYIINDGTSTFTVNVTQPVVSLRATDKAAVTCYPLPLSQLTALQDVKAFSVDVEVYPNVGTGQSVVKSLGQVNPAKLSTKFFFKHTVRAANRPYVYVNATTGVDAVVLANGATAGGVQKVSTDPAVAALNPFASIPSANSALAAATNLSGGYTSGGFIRYQGVVPDAAFAAGTYQLANGGAVILEADPADATAVFTWGATIPRNRQGSSMYIRNGKVQRVGGNFYGTAVWENVTLDNGGFNVQIAGQNTYASVNGMTVINGAGNILSAGATSEARLVRGVTSDTNMGVEFRVIVGNNFANGGSIGNVDARPAGDSICAYNYMMKCTTGFYSIAASYDVANIAIIQNIWENIAATTTLTCRMSGDIGLGSVRNFNCWNNEYISYGIIARQNWGYVDGVSGGAGQQRQFEDWSVHGNVFSQLNMKGEVFVCTNNSDGGGPDPVGGVNALGNLAIRNGVGFSYNMTMYVAADGSPPSPTASFAQEYPGIGAISGTSLTVRSDPLYVDYKAVVSNTVAGAGGGNYRKQAGSPCKGVVPLAYEKCPFDLDGVPRTAAMGSIGAYA